MLGEEPEEPEEPEEAEDVPGEDKLAPKNKIYSEPIRAALTTRIANDVEARGNFIYLEPDSCRAERAMELRFKNIQNSDLAQVKEDHERIQVMDTWSKGRSRMTK